MHGWYHRYNRQKYLPKVVDPIISPDNKTVYAAFFRSWNVRKNFSPTFNFYPLLSPEIEIKTETPPYSSLLSKFKVLLIKKNEFFQKIKFKKIKYFFKNSPGLLKLKDLILSCLPSIILYLVLVLNRRVYFPKIGSPKIGLNG